MLRNYYNPNRNKKWTPNRNKLRKKYVFLIRICNALLFFDIFCNNNNMTWNRRRNYHLPNRNAKWTPNRNKFRKRLLFLVRISQTISFYIFLMLIGLMLIWGISCLLGK